MVHFNHTYSRNLTTWANMRTSQWKPNYGDMLVCASILRQIKCETRNRVGFGYKLAGHTDRAIIRGSTYLHNHFDFGAANFTLDSIDAPLAIVGLGAQNPTQDITFLDKNDAARSFIARLNEKSESISVRGDFSAEIVERLGGKNIRITGCPSLFYTLSCPRVGVPEMLRYPQRSLGVSLHTTLTDGIFCNSPRRTRQFHGVVLDFVMKNSANVSLFEQGVPVEYNVADRTLSFAERLDCARKIISYIEAEKLFAPHDLIAYMVSVKNVEEWLDKVSVLDAVIGFRFHGNVAALLQGLPCYYYTYDSRIKEFCDLYELPQQDVNDDWTDPVAAMIGYDWNRTNRRIAACFEELKVFYAENGFEMVLGLPAN